MVDSESIKKILRSVLQSSKEGVSVNSLQSEYRSLCGEGIPLKKLGFSKLEDYLKSVPSVVRLEHRMGELRCFAAVCRETAHIAELVARQKASKKSGRSQVVNCKMRFKPSNPFMLNARPRSSLRQPSPAGSSNWYANRSRAHGGSRVGSASGDYRQLDQKLRSITPVEHRQPAVLPAAKHHITPDRREKSFANSQESGEKSPQQLSRPNQSGSGVYDTDVVQSRLVKLLEKYYSGLWMSKLSEVYGEMFREKLHPQALVELEQWTHICTVEKPSISCRADRLVYPPQCPATPTNSSTITTPMSLRSSTPQGASTPLLPSPVPKPRITLQNPFGKPQPVCPSSGKQSSLVSGLKNPVLSPRLHFTVNANDGCEDNLNLPTTALTQKQNAQPFAPTWLGPLSTNAPPVASSAPPGPDILPLLKATFSPAAVVSVEVRQRIKELLSKYSHGLWAHALPKLFMDTYKTPFPQHILDNLSVLLDICTVEYPVSHDKKAILYNSSRSDVEAKAGQESRQCQSHPLPTGLEVVGSAVPPCLVLPSEHYPSVLITDAKSCNAVTIRYVGENYSNAQEAMEDTMHSFYSQGSTHRPLSNPAVGQLVAVRGEDGDEVARAQVVEVMVPDKVKVYYVDHGFSVETSGTNVLELHPDFLCLPFQATNIRLAGLEAFSSSPSVLSSLDKLAVGKILLMETLEACQQNETPVAVLYDTSQEDDININSTCLKALQDETMNNPLTVNATYRDVCVTNVCADGVIYCQLPSRGTARLSKLLEELEAVFNSQITSESLVSRPFSGKFCLARYNGKWSRVEITNMYGNRVMEILYIDFGVSATVEVTDLREIPLLFLKDFTVIPPQAIKCRLADLTVPEGDWSPEVVQWVKGAVMGSKDCKMKILKLEQQKGGLLACMYLFIGADGQETDKSVNHQLAQSDLWHRLKTQNKNTVPSINSDTGLSPLLEKLYLSSPVPACSAEALTGSLRGAGDSSLPLPPPLELPQPGQNVDVFVSVACHPGHFVLQLWQDLHKLEVLIGEMILYYNQMWKPNTTTHIQKGEVYAAKIDKKWLRVQVKGIVANGLVSVYELDHGKHELLRSTQLQPLIEEFRQLPFQAIPAQLAGVTQHQWSEEASMLFRNHVEDQAVVALVESVQEPAEVKGELWERRLTVYLVDTTVEEKDLWIHSIIADINGELSSAA